MQYNRQRAWQTVRVILSHFILVANSPNMSHTDSSRKNHPRSDERPAWLVTLWAVVAAFGTYFCMYAFRKPFTAASYSKLQLWGVDYKTILVTAQVLGYMVSKFIGIKVIAEMTAQRRAVMILILIAVAEAALLLFGITPYPYNFVWLFVNGLPLGMVFGLVLGFLEGRCLTEALTAGLCASFVLADGATKSVGEALLRREVPEFWMPFLAGMAFVPPLLVCVWMLTRIPPPNGADIAHRNERVPINRAERRALFARYALGLTLLVAMYLLITILRSIRADFAKEIFQDLGVEVTPQVFTRSEIWVALGVLLVNGCGVFIRDNRRAFFSALGTSLAGLMLIAVAIFGLRTSSMGGFAFMVTVGVGLYLPYVATHTAIFERMIAMTRERGNLGFLMYLADAFGYLGYVAVMLLRPVIKPGNNMLEFFVTSSLVAVVASVLCLVASWYYFAMRVRPQAVSIAESVIPAPTALTENS